MSLRFHLISFAAILVWTALGVLFPSWEGKSYNPDRIDQPVNWHKGGTFGLRRGWSGDLNLAPVWDPPRPHAGAIEATVRWPWQAPSRGAHVEISLPTTVIWISSGLILLGVIGRVATSIHTPSCPDLVVVVTWSVALGLIVGFVLGFMLVVFTMGMAPELYYLIPIFLGGLGGLIVGLVSAARTRKLPENGAPAHPQAGRSRGVETGMLWFALGFVASTPLPFLGSAIARRFRGPVLRISPLFTPEYEREQWPIDLALGASVCLTGWIVGIWLYRARQWRALGVGLITGATIFGVLSAT